MAFAGKHVLVTGGTGMVGSAITKVLLTQGAKVTVTTRSEDNFNEVKNSLPAQLRANLFCVVTDINTEDGVQKVFDKTTAGDGVQHVVASIGSWWQGGKLVDQTLAEYNKGMLTRVTGHFLLFKAFIPYLDKQTGSTYTILTGNAGDEYVAPNISLLCVSSGALNGLNTAAITEHKDSNVAVADFRIHIMVQRKNDSEVAASEKFTVGNDVVGEAIVKTMANRSRGRFNVRCRQDARDMA